MSLSRYREILIVASATDIHQNKTYVLEAIRDWWIETSKQDGSP